MLLEGGYVKAATNSLVVVAGSLLTRIINLQRIRRCTSNHGILTFRPVSVRLRFNWKRISYHLFCRLRSLTFVSKY